MLNINYGFSLVNKRRRVLICHRGSEGKSERGGERETYRNKNREGKKEGDKEKEREREGEIMKDNKLHIYKLSITLF